MEDTLELRKRIGIKTLAPKKRTDAYAPISHLPDELLLEIFRQLRDTGHEMIHNASHVCQHWRHIALETSSLWTNPPTHHHNLTLLMLWRSRTSPLSIHFNNSSRAKTSAAVLNHIERIESLIMEQWKHRLGPLLDTLLHSLTQHGAVQLRTLKIKQIYVTGTNNLVKISASTFRQIPILQNLSLANVDFDWQIFPIPSLTSLHLSCPHLSTPPSWAEFQYAVNQMPRLEYLGILLLYLRPIEPPGRSGHMKLPLLRKLEVHESSASVTRSFLLNSSFPQLQNARIVCSFNDSSDVDPNYAATLNAILSLITNGNFDHLDNLSIGEDTFTLSTGTIQTYESTVKFEARCLARMDTIRALMTELAAAPGDLASQIMHLCLSEGLTTFTAAHLVELSGHFSQLESIQVDASYLDPRQTIKGLQAPPLHPPGAPIPFPRLCSLELRGIPHTDEDIPGILKELGDCLRRRYSYGARLTKLFVGWDLVDGESQIVQALLTELGISK